MAKWPRCIRNQYSAVVIEPKILDSIGCPSDCEEAHVWSSVWARIDALQPQHPQQTPYRASTSSLLIAAPLNSKNLFSHSQSRSAYPVSDFMRVRMSTEPFALDGLY